MDTETFTGTWSYRSFVNNPDLDVNFDDLLFGAGTMTLYSPRLGQLSGTLGGTGWQLNLKGAASYGNPFACRLQGVGEIGGDRVVHALRLEADTPVVARSRRSPDRRGPEPRLDSGVLPQWGASARLGQLRRRRHREQRRRSRTNCSFGRSRFAVVD